jgi:hypothetical protein
MSWRSVRWFLPRLSHRRASEAVWSLGPEGAWQLGARMLEKTDTKQGARFRKGQSGNPSGRPPGARNKTTLAVEALLDGEAEVLTRKAIERAKDGDSVALRLCLERILPPRKDRPVSFALPKIESVADAGKASTAILTAVATGDVTPLEAEAALSSWKVTRRFLRSATLKSESQLWN